MSALKNKIVLVTGGSGLLGKEIISDIIRKEGVALNLDISHETDLKQNQIKCDVTSEKSIENAMKRVVEKYGKIDGIVNNAYPRTKDWGIGFEKMSAESLSKNVDKQMNSYLNFCKAAIPYFRETGKGSVVNMTSIYGVVGNNFNIYEETDMEPPMAYSAIKGGLINATRFLASKYGKENMRFNCVSPGGIFDNQPIKFVEAYKKQVPIRRMGYPDDIAPSVSFLLSDEAKYITGHNLIVDGGWTVI